MSEIKAKFLKCISFIFVIALLFPFLSSCSKKLSDDLEIKISPAETIVLGLNAYSCAQIVRGEVGFNYTPEFSAPIVVFNKFTMKWKKSTKLIINQVKIKFRGAGIAGGESTCDLTGEIGPYFESTNALALQDPLDTYSGGTFTQKGTIVSDPRCRVICNVPLQDPEVPEINANGELLVRATELTNEGQDNEKYYRVKSRFTLKVVP